MNILTIDPGIKCGWACRSHNSIDSGVQEFPLNRGDSPGMRYVRFRDWFAELLKATKPDLVVYERPFVRGGHATEFLNGLTSRIQEECAKRNVDYEAVNPMTLKKAITSSGNANKADMIKAANEAWGWVIKRNIVDDNEADALNLLTHATFLHDQITYQRERG